MQLYYNDGYIQIIEDDWTGIQNNASVGREWVGISTYDLKGAPESDFAE